MRIIRDIVIAVLLAIIAVFLLSYVRGMQEDEMKGEEEDSTVKEETVMEDVVLEVPAFATGVIGTVFVGPQCPVQQEEVSCPDAPYEGVIDVVVNDPERELIARVRTDSNGSFATALPAGPFVVVVQTEGTFPICPEEEINISEGEVVSVAITCDSGIR